MNKTDVKSAVAESTTATEAKKAEVNIQAYLKGHVLHGRTGRALDNG